MECFPVESCLSGSIWWSKEDPIQCWINGLTSQWRPFYPGHWCVWQSSGCCALTSPKQLWTNFSFRKPCPHQSREKLLRYRSRIAGSKALCEASLPIPSQQEVHHPDRSSSAPLALQFKRAKGADRSLDRNPLCIWLWNRVPSRPETLQRWCSKPLPWASAVSVFGGGIRSQMSSLLEVSLEEHYDAEFLEGTSRCWNSVSGQGYPGGCSFEMVLNGSGRFVLWTNWYCPTLGLGQTREFGVFHWMTSWAVLQISNRG